MAEEFDAAQLRPRAIMRVLTTDTTYQELTFDEGPPIVPLDDWVKTVFVECATDDVRVSHVAADGATQASVADYEVITAGVRTPIRRRDGLRVLLSTGSGVTYEVVADALHAGA